MVVLSPQAQSHTSREALEALELIRTRTCADRPISDRDIERSDSRL